MDGIRRKEYEREAERKADEARKTRDEVCPSIAILTASLCWGTSGREMAADSVHNASASIHAAGGLFGCTFISFHKMQGNQVFT